MITELPMATANGRAEENRHNVGIYGESGSGKTAWTEEVLLANKKRLLILDTLCKDYGNPEFCQANKIAYDLVTYDVREALDFLASHEEGDFRIVARCPSDALQLLKVFVYNDADKRALLTDCTLAIEEISLLMDSTKIPDELADIIVRGRHSRINLVGIAQVPTAQTHPLYRSQLNYLVSFRQTGKNAIQFFQDYDEEAEKLRDLEKGHGVLLKGDPAAFQKWIEEP